MICRCRSGFLSGLIMFAFLFQESSFRASSTGELMPLTVTSSAFKNGATLPRKYTCEGANVNPELVISGIPSSATSLVVIVDDPDAPAGLWTHWVVYNIPVNGSKFTVAENAKQVGLTRVQIGSGTNGEMVEADEAANSFGATKYAYGGACPPPGKAHRYNFKVWAVRGAIPSGSTLNKVKSFAKDNALAHGNLMARFAR